MDYILKRFEASINLSKPGQTERFNFLKARIEYIYYLLLGYTWNKHKNEVRLSELTSFFDARTPTVSATTRMIQTNTIFLIILDI